jgi:hypothetical protein
METLFSIEAYSFNSIVFDEKLLFHVESTFQYYTICKGTE